MAGKNTSTPTVPHAESGSVLWHDSTGGAVGGGVISYQTRGHQHIAVATGISGRNALPRTPLRRQGGLIERAVEHVVQLCLASLLSELSAPEDVL